MRKIQKFLSTNTGTLQNLNHLRKFYKEATIHKVQNPPHIKHKFTIKLDGKSVRTPNRNILACPSQQLAFLIAHQFNSQVDYLKPALMPLLSYSRTAVDIDLTQGIRQHLTSSIYQYLLTDTLLFCAESFQSYQQKYQSTSLKAVQNFQNLFKMKLKPSYTIDPPQVITSQDFVNYVESLDNWKLLSLQSITTTLKSSIAAILIAQQKILVQQGIKMSRMQEIFQVQRFGIVEQKQMEANYISFIMNSVYLFHILSK